jgi:hypothetical protein
MREDSRRKLDRLLAADRRIVIFYGAALTMLFGVGYVAWVAPSRASRDATGIVRKRWTTRSLETQKVTLKLEVLLDDGRYAVATATHRNLPEIGSRITLREETNWFWYHLYYWDGDIPPQTKVNR